VHQDDVLDRLRLRSAGGHGAEQDPHRDGRHPEACGMGEPCTDVVLRVLFTPGGLHDIIPCFEVDI